jgi:hypothetical protein
MIASMTFARIGCEISIRIRHASEKKLLLKNRQAGKFLPPAVAPAGGAQL